MAPRAGWAGLSDPQARGDHSRLQALEGWGGRAGSAEGGMGVGGRGEWILTADPSPFPAFVTVGKLISFSEFLLCKTS